MKKGFTLIELFVVISIIGILSSVLFLGRTGAEKRLALQRAAYQLAQDLREVQEMTMGAEEAECGTYSFGIYFHKISSPDSYLVFADCNNNQYRDSADDILKQVDLEKEVQISELEEKVVSTSLTNSLDTLDIVFLPPHPSVFIEREKWDREATITLQLDSATKKVKINSAGRIEIE